jgi:hypothetical protein
MEVDNNILLIAGDPWEILDQQLRPRLQNIAIYLIMSKYILLNILIVKKWKHPTQRQNRSPLNSISYGNFLAKTVSICKYTARRFPGIETGSTKSYLQKNERKLKIRLLRAGLEILQICKFRIWKKLFKVFFCLRQAAIKANAKSICGSVVNTKNFKTNIWKMIRFWRVFT